MNKRVLLLTAATAALMSGPAFATCPSSSNWTTISTGLKVNVDTACANNGQPGTITITTTGSVVISTSPYTTPAVTIDSGTSGSPGIVQNNGTISYQGVTNAVGVQLNANGNVGGIDNAGTGIINLNGAGTNKVGILLEPLAGTTSATTGLFTGATPSTTSTPAWPFLPLGVPTFFSSDPIAIALESGSTTEVQGTESYGIEALPGTTLDGDIQIAGTLEVTPTSTTSTSATANYAIYLGGLMNGSLIVLPGGVVSSTGAATTGVAVAAPSPGTGGITGSIVNYGIIEAAGITSPSTASNASNPEGGQALYIGANVTGGILNAGKSSATDTTTAATITSVGTGPALDITTAVGALTAGSVTIGKYADPNDPDFSEGYSVINRGTISASAENPNISVNAIAITGSSPPVYSSGTPPVLLSPGTFVNLVGGIFDSGTISAVSTNDDNGSATSASAIVISNNATVPKIVTNTQESGAGSISATVSGPFGGTAIGIQVTQGGVLPEIDNQGIISAVAATTVLTNTNITAEAIVDSSGENPMSTGSGTIQTINNSGTISATATTLDNDRQVARAIDLTGSTQNVTVNNSGSIIGDVVFGIGQNTLNDGNAFAQNSSIEGNVYFGGDPKADDMLTIFDNASLTGSVFEGASGRVSVDIQGGGKLILQNSTIPLNSPIIGAATNQAAPLLADSFTVETGSTLDITVSQPFNILGTNPATGQPNVAVPGIVEANKASIGNNSTVNLVFGSFVASPTGQSVAVDLISAPTGQIMVSPTQLQAMAVNVDSEVPFLFQSTSNLCTQNILNSPIPCATTIGTPAGTSQIDLVLIPKTAQQLGLTGYANLLFPYANEALATDNTLGAGVVNAITTAATAQSTYASFAPDVSGATRATAISLTDSATDVVATRQRELNMYANQEGDTTLWGQEFVQRLSQDGTPGALGYNDTGFGFVLGMDGGDPVDGRYGGAFTFFSGNAVEKDPVDVRTGSSYFLGTFYTNWRGKGLFLDTQWTAGWGELRGKRSIDAGGVDRTASGDRPTQMAAGSISTGAIFNFGGTVITPQFDVDGLTLREDGYTEGGGQNVNGGDGFDLRVQPYYTNSARGFLGVDLRQDLNFGDFYLQPEVRGGYRYDFLDGAEKLKVNFVGVTPIDQFTITGPQPAKGNLVGTAGIAVTTGAWSVGFSYDYLHAASGNTQQDGMITLIGRI